MMQEWEAFGGRINPRALSRYSRVLQRNVEYEKRLEWMEEDRQAGKVLSNGAGRKRKMEFAIREYNEYNEKEILSLYTSVGWTNYTDRPEMLKNAYAHSLKIYGAYVDDKLVGIVRVVGDGYSVVFIQDLLIYPAYQRKGIGRALLQHILSEYRGVYQKHLLTENTEKTIQFYKSIGFIMDTDMECRAFSKYF